MIDQIKIQFYKNSTKIVIVGVLMKCLAYKCFEYLKTRNIPFYKQLKTFNLSKLKLYS